MKTNTNDPANPIDDNTLIAQMGLTKREAFAAMAMQGLRASKLIATVANLRHGPLSDKIWSSEAISKLAVQDADALIKELNKEE